MRELKPVSLATDVTQTELVLDEHSEWLVFNIIFHNISSDLRPLWARATKDDERI